MNPQLTPTTRHTTHNTPPKHTTKRALIITFFFLFALTGVTYAATNVYYSVGQNTNDHKTGSPNVTISSGVATFTVAQTAANLGVGDRLTAGGNAYYLKSKISTTQWNVVTKLGAVPADLGSTAVTSIAHEYSSLSAAEAGASDADHINNASLVAADVILNIPCYYDTGADTTIVEIDDGWTTDGGHYFNIYTPYNTSTECNQSQRHTGKWDTSKYRLEVNDTGWGWTTLRSRPDFTRISGLQIMVSSYSNDGVKGMLFDNGNYRVSHCIIKAGTATYKAYGIHGNYYHAAWKAYNNIIYGFTNGIVTGGSNAGLTTYLYNNTFYNCGTGINGGGDGLEVAKNNLFASCTTAASGTFAAGTDYNATNNASMGYTVTGGGNTHDRTSQTFTFVDSGNADFHLTYTDAGARNYGVDLAGDSYIAVTDDIEGHSRPTGSNVVDIGADEYQAQPIYRSVGVYNGSLVTQGPTSGLVLNTSFNDQDMDLGLGSELIDNGNFDANITGWTITQCSGSSISWQNAVSGDGSTGYMRFTIGDNTCWDRFRKDGNVVSASTAYRVSFWYRTSGITGNLRAYFTDNFDTLANAVYGSDLTPSTSWQFVSFDLTTNSLSYPVFGIHKYQSIGAGTFDVDAISVKTISGTPLAYDRSGQANNGTLTNGPTSTTGKIGQALDFDGGDDYVDAGTDPEFDNMSALTISEWANARSYGEVGQGYFMSKFNYNVGWRFQKLVTGSKVWFEVKYDGGTDLSVDAASNTLTSAEFNTWIHWAVTWDGTANYSGVHIYKNGTEVSYGTRTNGVGNRLDDNTVSLNIGNMSGSTRTFDGSLDEVRIYNRVLSSSEITELYNLGSSSLPTLTISSSTATFSSALPNNVGVGDVIQYKASGSGGPDSLAFISGRTSSTQYSVQNVNGGIASLTPSATTDWQVLRAYTSLANAESGTENTGIIASLRNFDTWSGGKNLGTSTEQWNIACYADAADTTTVTIDGWTTTADNYIKIYTPTDSSEVGTSQRHAGKWDTGKYRLETGADSLTISQEHVRVEGLQIYSTASKAVNGVKWTGSGADIRMSHNIIKGNNSLAVWNSLIYFQYYNGASIIRFWNNIIYDQTATNTHGMWVRDANITCYVYNNTFYNINYDGLFQDTGSTVIVKNNLFKQMINACDGTFAAGTDYNATNNASMGYTVTGGGNTHDRTSQTFTFVASDDFHLASTDAGAKNYGADLSGDSNLAFTTDIDLETRSGTWDIGADEYQAGETMNVYYSVGQNTTDHKTGSPNVTISSGVATFTAAQTAANLGVGDRLTAGGNAYYLKSKISTTQWNVVTKLGAVPSDLGSTAVTSIAHEYTSLSAAEAGAADANHINNTSLVAANVILNIPCYYDTGADTATVTINGWTTDATRYIKIYTPTNTSTECNQSQRHSGKYNTSKYRLETDGALYTIDNQDNNYLKIDGIQIKYIYSGASSGRAFLDRSTTPTYISNNIIEGVLSGVGDHRGIDFWAGGGPDYAWNNIVYGFITGSAGIGIQIENNVYIYNNTVYNSYYGINRQSGTAVLKNNISYNNTDNYSGTFDSSGTNNLSGPGTDAQMPTTNSRNGVTVTFVDATNKDFHITSSDAGAKDYGTNLSGDSNLAFTTDIDLETRSGTWDIGADEYYSSVAGSEAQLKDCVIRDAVIR